MCIVSLKIKSLGIVKMDTIDVIYQTFYFTILGNLKYDLGREIYRSGSKTCRITACSRNLLAFSFCFAVIFLP